MTLQDVTNGQTFTNGTTDTIYIMVDAETFKIRNTETNKESIQTVCTVAFNVEDAKEVKEERIFTDFYGNAVELTDKEIELVEQLDELIGYDANAHTYIDELGLSYSSRVARGVLSSLVKKEVCSVEDGMICYSMGAK